MKGKSVLISGAGVAGPTLAYWLERSGQIPTLLERAPQLRAGGYVVDFWGLGYDIAEKMGVLPDILRSGYRMREVRLVDDRGRRAGGFDAELFREAAFGRYTTVPRSDLAAILFRAIEPRIETHFGDSIVGLEEQADGILVSFANSPARRFDLVIGADGLHSTVRALVFGSESRFEKFLGYIVAAFEVAGYSHRDENVYVAYSAPGCQIARFSLRGDRTLFLIICAEDAAGIADAHDDAAQRRYLHRRLSGLGWECPQILEALDRCSDLYFDPVSQIQMDRWTKGRVALVGDAAYAASLLAGQGSALAIIGAYSLAGELARAERVEDAFARYETVLQPFLLRKQKAALGFASSFAPKTRFGIFLRNQITKLFAARSLAKITFGKAILDRIQLPSYEMPGAS